jgi:hypothetical protein
MKVTSSFNSKSLLLAAAMLPSLASGALYLMDYSCDPAKPTICAKGEFTTPSPAQIGNTTTYLGGYTYDYSYLPAGLDDSWGTTWTVPYANVHIVRADDDSCTVSVDDTNCTSCSFCTSSTVNATHAFSTDCTNVPNGRKVSCDPAGPPFFFFPLTSAAIQSMDTSTNGTASDFIDALHHNGTSPQKSQEQNGGGGSSSSNGGATGNQGTPNASGSAPMLSNPLLLLLTFAGVSALLI